MKNLIRGAALFIGGMIGLSGCLITSASGAALNAVAWGVCGIITVIGIIYLFAAPTKELFLPNREEQEEERDSE